MTTEAEPAAGVAGAFALVEKGAQFIMGSPDDEEGLYDDEGPQRGIVFGDSFAIARFALTFDEYDLFCAETGARRPDDRGWGRGRRPVINVSWNDICDPDPSKGYLAWLNDTLGLTGRDDAYRLPLEAEWEYSCRAGETTPFSFGETISTDQANYDGNFTYGNGKKGEYRQQTVPVDEFAPNMLGLYQMHGNVWEWCADTWQSNYNDFPEEARAGKPQTSDDGTARVVRGGSWSVIPPILRSALRFRITPSNRNSHIGFRLARTILRQQNDTKYFLFYPLTLYTFIVCHAPALSFRGVWGVRRSRNRSGGSISR